MISTEGALLFLKSSHNLNTLRKTYGNNPPAWLYPNVMCKFD